LPSSRRISLPIYKYTKYHPGNRIIVKPLKEIYTIEQDFSLFLMHYINDLKLGDNKLASVMSGSYNEALPQFFDKPIANSDLPIYDNMLMEAIGKEKYNETYEKLLNNEYSRYKQYLEGKTWWMQNVEEWINKHPKDEVWKTKCTDYISTMGEYLTRVIPILEEYDQKDKNRNVLDSFFSEINRLQELDMKAGDKLRELEEYSSRVYRK
jgi:hypothetical protein